MTTLEVKVIVGQGENAAIFMEMVTKASAGENGRSEDAASSGSGQKVCRSPGDLCPTMTRAATVALDAINPTSIKKHWEYTGWILQVPGGFTFTIPTTDKKNDEVTVGDPPAASVAQYHTHGADEPGYDNEHFSREDADLNIELGRYGYLETPSGKILMFDPFAKKVHVIRRGGNDRCRAADWITSRKSARSWRAKS